MSLKEKLLWDSPEFAKMYSSAEKLTGYYARLLLKRSGIEETSPDVDLIVLDNACGTGVISVGFHDIMASRNHGNFELVCGDFADAMVGSITARIETSGWKNTKAMKVDAQDTKLPNAHFTHVFTNFGPMLFPDPQAMLSECYRMLQAKGCCAFTTWKQIDWITDVREAFLSIPELPQLPTDNEIISAFGPGDWMKEEYAVQQLKAHGFQDVKVVAVPNKTTYANFAEIKGIMTGTVATVTGKLWTEEQRQKWGGPSLNDGVMKFMSDKYGNGPIEWNWVAILSTGFKPASA